MSFGIVRVQKFKAQGVRGIQSHDHRERESRTNPDIDKERISQNYALVESPDWNKAISERLSTLESTKAVRKDAVVMVQLMVTSDHDFFKSLTPEKEKAFFEESLRFIQERYGAENIFSAIVHKDEKTPHMHVNLTPIRERRLTAKEIFNRADVTSLHTDFFQAVGQKWNLKRGESREEKRQHLDTEAFKLATRRKELEKQSMTLQPKVEQVQPDDLTPRQFGSKMLGLVKDHESPEMVANRVNERFIKPISERLAQVPILQRKVQELESIVKAHEAVQAEQVPELNILGSYRKNFRDGLTEEQQKALQSRANEFRTENVRQAEKERQEAAEREKQARQEKTERERQAVQRREFEFKYGRFVTHWAMSEEKKVAAVTALGDEWAKASDKEAFIKLLPERFPELKRENERKARSRGPSLGR